MLLSSTGHRAALLPHAREGFRFHVTFPCLFSRRRSWSSRSYPLRAVALSDFEQNLGALASTVKVDDQAETLANVQLVSPERFAEQGIVVDSGAIFASSLLLLLLLSLSLRRILGLDRLLAQALREWKVQRAYQRREEAILSREKLERLWQDDVKDKFD